MKVSSPNNICYELSLKRAINGVSLGKLFPAVCVCCWKVAGAY